MDRSRDECRLQGRVGAITKGAVTTVFTVAQSHPLLRFKREYLWLKCGALVRPITEGLVRRLVARPPVVCACGQFQNGRRLRWNRGFLYGIL